MRWKCRAERGRPGYPGFMQQKEVAPIMGNQNPRQTNSTEQLRVVGQPDPIEVAGADDIVTSGSQGGCEVQGHIVVKVEADQAGP